MSNSAILKSSIAKKYWMALTGLFLCLFLVGHLAGNLQLLMPFGEDARNQFNDYAYFMTHNPAVKILSYLTYFSILFHAIDGILLAVQNVKARPVKYGKNKASANSSWISRNMAPLGTLILAFIIMHMAQFWGRMHFGELDTYMMDGNEVKDLYVIVIAFFAQEGMGIVWSLIYLVGVASIMFHLIHGFQSAFQTLGLKTAKYSKNIERVGLFFAIVIPLGFAIIPFYIHFALDVPAEFLEMYK